MAIKVFIDTSVYENANFSFGNKQFSKLKELIEEESVELLYNEIVYREVYQHIGDNLSGAVSQYNQVIEENRAFAPFRRDDKWAVKISQIDVEEIVADLREYWSNYIADVGANKIPIGGVDVDDIIDKYFKKRFPFESKKPTEFKDAICIDSIMKYYDSITDEIVCVIAADKGFRKSFKGIDGFEIFSDLNGFLKYAISQTEHLSVEIEKAFESGALDKGISKRLDNLLYMESVDIEDVYDEIDLLNAETQFIEYGYIHDIDEESALVIANAEVEVTVEYKVRDEDNSYYDREDGRYYYESFMTYRATFSVNLEIEVSVVIENKEEDLSITLELDDVNLDTNLYLHESDIIESEMIHSTMDDFEDEDAFDENARYCPDCGCKMDYENDMGAFCMDCAPNH